MAGCFRAGVLKAAHVLDVGFESSQPTMKKIGKKIRAARHRFYGWLGVKRYRYAQRPKPILSLEDLLGEEEPQENDQHFKNIDIPALFQKYHLTPKGVIHVGAHEAGELEKYVAMGFSTILYVEANPALIPRLKEKAAACTGARVLIAHVAVTDHNGKITLRVTSMDQSSSILPLGIHKNIYPSIREGNQIDVPARTLDHLVYELGLAPNLFNFLNLDIQGAELLALKGASRLLGNIEAIVSEVNLVELYQGAALLPQLEAHLRAAGFNRAAMFTPWHPTWGDAFFVKRPVVTMSSLGKNGRFANQLFQYLYLRLVAEKQGAIVQTPDWAGRALFGLEDPEPIGSFPLVHEVGRMELPPFSSEVPDPVALIQNRQESFPDTDFWGWFALHTGAFAPYRDFIRQIFTLVPRLHERLNLLIANLCLGNRKLIAVHLRRGDYGYSSFFRTPCSWYEKWIGEENFSPDTHVIYIASESAELYRARFPGFRVVTSQDAGCPDSLAPYFDFFVLREANVLAISNSTYSFLASMLNRQSEKFFRPCSEIRGLISFDPWNAQVFLRREVSDAEHKEFAMLD